MRLLTSNIVYIFLFRQVAAQQIDDILK